MLSISHQTFTGCFIISDIASFFLRHLLALILLPLVFELFFVRERERERERERWRKRPMCRGCVWREIRAKIANFEQKEQISSKKSKFRAKRANFDLGV